MAKAKRKNHTDPGLELARQIRLLRWRLRANPNQTWADYEIRYGQFDLIDWLCYQLIDLRQPTLPFDKEEPDGPYESGPAARLGEAKTLHNNRPLGCDGGQDRDHGVDAGSGSCPTPA